MSEKTPLATVQTWNEAMDAGVLPHEHMETVKAAAQQIYPDSLDECTLDSVVMKEIEADEPRANANAEDGIAPVILNFEAAAEGPAVQETPTAARARGRKRAAEAALDHIRYTPQAAKFATTMSDTKRAATLKQQEQFQKQEQSIGKVDTEMRRIFEKEFGEELRLRTEGRIRAKDPGYGYHLYWLAYQTQVIRMPNHKYNDMQEEMVSSAMDRKHSTPQEILLHLERYFEAFEEAGRKMSPSDKERVYIRAVENRFSTETANCVRALPRTWNLSKKDYPITYDAIRAAVTMHVRDRQIWPGVATPSKLKMATTDSSKESPGMEEMQELRAQVLKLAQAINGNQQGPKRTNFVQKGLRRGPDSSKGDSKSIWEDKAACAYHTKAGGKGSHTNATCHLRDATNLSYSKEHDNEIKKFLKK